MSAVLASEASNALNFGIDAKSVIDSFTNNKFNFLAQDTDKIKALSTLIEPCLPSQQMLENVPQSAVISDTYKYLIQLESLYTTSLLSDLVNKNHSVTTEKLQTLLIEGYKKSSSNSAHAGVSDDVAKGAIFNMIEKPLAEIASGLQLGKEKSSFLSRLF